MYYIKLESKYVTAEGDLTKNKEKAYKFPANVARAACADWNRDRYAKTRYSYESEVAGIKIGKTYHIPGAGIYKLTLAPPNIVLLIDFSVQHIFGYAVTVRDPNNISLEEWDIITDKAIGVTECI